MDEEISSGEPFELVIFLVLRSQQQLSWTDDGTTLNFLEVKPSAHELEDTSRWLDLLLEDFLVDIHGPSDLSLAVMFLAACVLLMSSELR